MSVLSLWQITQNSFAASYGGGFNPDNYILCMPDKKVISFNKLQKEFKKALSECALPEIRLHDLRHSWATLMLKNNITAKLTSEMLGHSNISTILDIYTHVKTEMQLPAIDVISDVFKWL